MSPRRRSWLLAAAGIAILAACGLVIGIPAWVRANRSDAAGSNAAPTSLAALTVQTLSSQIRIDGTLGYAGNYSAVNQARGTMTALPAIGEIVSQGQRLYAVDGSPVVLLYGETPAYRTLSMGVVGPDVAQLNANLAALGYAGPELADADIFSAETESALKAFQAVLGWEETGSLALDQAIFLPSAARITTIGGTLGAPAQPGAVLLRATSTTPQVTAALNAERQAAVNVGDHLTVLLPNGKNVQGRVSSVGTVATLPASPGGPGGSSGKPTIPVEIALLDPATAGSADQAPVQVLITTSTVTDALVVPVTALLAVSGVGYAVEVVDDAGARQLVPVSLGLFDESNGLVQVNGSGLAAGQQVVVPGQ